MEGYYRIKVYGLNMSTNRVQWNHVGTFLSRKGAEAVRKAMKESGVVATSPVEFEIKEGDSLLHEDRIAVLRKEGFKVKVLGKL